MGKHRGEAGWGDGGGRGRGRDVGERVAGRLTAGDEARAVLWLSEALKGQIHQGSGLVGP